MSTMHPISGRKIDGRSLPQFTWNADLVAFDGPFLSLYKSEDGDDALFAWLDCDSKKNRWCILHIGRENLRAYLTRNATLLDLFKNSPSIVIFETGATSRKSNFVLTSFEKFPADYVPSQDSYLLPEISTEAAKQLANDLPTNYSIGLDGELYLEDLEKIPKLYQQLYSFHYGLEHLTRTAVRSTLARIMARWRGGFSAVNLFTGLRSVTPSIHRARLMELKYNSPGHIKLNLLPNMALRIKAAAARLESYENFQSAEELYKSIYKYFKEQNISGLEDERSTQEIELTPNQQQRLDEFITNFFKIMAWDGYRSNFQSLEISPISQLRVLLAYYRRLRKLRNYIVADKVELA